MRIVLLGEERAELLTRHTQNLEAYDMFLKGLYFVHKRTADDLRKAIDSLEQAIELDPDYALANAILAESYGLLPFYTYISTENVFTKAKSAAMKALHLDEDLAEAHSALGFIKMYYEWDWAGAEKELKRAIQINPSYVTAHHWYAEYLAFMGRHEEALEEVHLALEIDPLSLLENYEKAFILHYARQYDKSIEQCLKTLELDQNYKLTYLTLTRSYLQKGMHEEALKAIQLKGSDLYLEYAYALAGQREESIRKIEEMKEQWKRENMHALPLAKVYAALSEEDLALDWLEKSLERREPNIVKLNVNPIFDGLRSNPRFKAILKKINLE